MTIKQSGILIPWQLIGVLLVILSGVIWINVQIAEMKQRIDFLYNLEMQRYQREGPRIPNEP